MSADARAAVLERIRAAKGGAGDLNAGVSAWGSLPRQYHRQAAVTLEAMLERLIERLVADGLSQRRNLARGRCGVGARGGGRRLDRVGRWRVERRIGHGLRCRLAVNAALDQVADEARITDRFPGALDEERRVKPVVEITVTLT